ncbi:LysR family transcriptional regulator [Dactylosporangium sp. NBC_01737]|uniref:LysR family transcriptional regulator n=1 Tax=Dactylosporangium sp. NBC_01737 TaxID=2975959 RepID=UPI002E15D00F|nr:LysR family transcriptional regulator [Dactylosporangium sp. NBC_01737]
MDTRQIRYFLAVVEHGGFGRAAAALNVAQPTMSQSVKALERDLGTALFHRASHGVTLSAAGRAFLGPARLLMRDVAVAGEAVGGRPEHDSLEIVASAPLGAHPGAALVGGFLRAHPGVSVSLDRDTEEALLARVRDGVSELGLVHLPAARLGLCEVELGAHDLVLVFPPPDTARPGGTRPASRRPGPPDAKPPAGPPATPRLTNLTAMAHQTDLTTAAHQAGLTDTTHQAGLIEATRQTHLTSAASQAGLSDAARRTDLTGATHQAGSAPAPRRTDSTGAPHPADVNSAARQAGPSGVALRPGRPEAPRQADLTGDARPAGSPDTAHEADPPGVTRHPGPPGTAGRTDLAGVARQAEGAHLAGVVRWGNPAGMVRRSGQGGGCGG